MPDRADGQPPALMHNLVFGHIARLTTAELQRYGLYEPLRAAVAPSRVPVFPGVADRHHGCTPGPRPGARRGMPSAASEHVTIVQ